MEEQVEQKTNKNLSTLSKYAGFCGLWSGVQAPVRRLARGDSNNNEPEERTAE